MTSVRRTRSWSWAPPSTTAGRRRSSPRGSITRSSLYLAGVAPNLVVTGGKADGDRTTEAASARAYAIARGVPASAILVEDASRTTRESIRGVSKLLRDHDLADAVFVSDRPHMLRVLRMARDDGIDRVGLADHDQPDRGRPAGRLDATLHELGALAQYFVLGRS